MCTQNKLFRQSSQIFKDNVFLKGLCSLLDASWQNMVIWLAITFPSCLAFCAFFLALYLSLVYVDISRRLIARVRVFWFLLVQGKMPLLNEVCLLDYHVLLFLVYPVNILSYFAIILTCCPMLASYLSVCEKKMLASYLSVYLRARLMHWRLAGAVQIKSQLDDNMTVGTACRTDFENWY